ncbi:RluA family pseudouridine synthase [Patescibacteria group bacterium]
MPEYQATETDLNKRFDIVLSEALELPRAQIQKLIKTGGITLNQKITKAHTPIKLGDVLSYPTLLMEPPKPKQDPAPILEIIYQDDQIMVINKPAGLLVHQVGPEDQTSTVVDGLLEMFPETAQVGDDPVRPGIVHRLDKDVSGVMVLAKTQGAFDNLKEQFSERSVKKEYLALCYGQLEKDHDTITLKIARSKTRGRMVARPEEQEGKEAHTEYNVLNRFKIATYLKVLIKTGRTHQIRAHFKAIDHPLVGDKLYKKTRMKNIHPIELNRIFLHAHKLTLTLADGKQKTFETPLPDDLEELLRALPKQ